MKPRIVLFSAFLTPFRSGAEACAEEVSLRLADQFDITIITARLRRDLPTHDLLQGKVDVVRVGFGLPIDKWLFPFLAPLAARKLKPQILHAVLESYAGLALIISRWIGPNAKRILTCQSTNTTLLIRAMHRAADTVTCISSVLMERAKKFGRPDAILISNGIDLAGIQDACRRYPKVPGRVLFVGRLEHMKGVRHLPQIQEALHAFFRTLPAPQDIPELHVVGSGSLEKGLREEFEALARELQLSRKPIMKGYLSGAELFREYAEAEVFCGLSSSEALGNVFLEAQAAGCAVVATDVGGIPDIVEHNKAGFLISPDHSLLPLEAGRNIVHLLQNPDRRREFSARAMQNAAAYDWGGIARKYGEIYTRVA